MRLIDADDRIEFIKNAYCPECDNYNGVRCRVCPINDMIEAIDDAPTVDRWHYPSKGELPDRDGEYLCRYYKYDLRFSKVSFYRVEDNKWYNLVYDEEYRVPKPDAWQYIYPPKEEV